MNEQVVDLRGSGETDPLNNCTDHNGLKRGSLTAARNSNRQTGSIGSLMEHDNGRSHGAGAYQQFQDNKGMEAADRPTHFQGLSLNKHPWKIVEFRVDCSPVCNADSGGS